MTYSIGIDVSRHQGKMDWQKCAAAGVSFAAIRATVGNYYTDPRFTENWQGAKDAGLLVTAYHVVTPEISVDAQMARFESVCDDYFPDLPFVLDCELSREQSLAAITKVIQGCAQNFIDIRGDNPIIYTRQNWWNNNVLPLVSWQKYPLWVANYTTAFTPALPRDWDEWYLWQHTSKGDGHKYGAESKSIDLNRMAVPLPEYPPPEPEPTGMIRTNTPGTRLRVRTAPVVKDATRIGSVPDGTMFKTVRRDGKWVVVEAYVYGDWVKEV